MKITMIRHTTPDVAKGVCYGQTDVALKTTFTEEAAITKTHLENLHFDAVYTSPFTRCTRLAAFCGYPDASRDDRLKEMNFGAWEMQAYDKIQDPHLKAFYDDYMHVAATDGESFEMLYHRVASFLDELRQKEWSHVAIFAHGGVLVSAQIYAGLFSREEDPFSHLTPFGGIIHLEL